MPKLGGGRLVVIGLSSWLGKVWANHPMIKNRAKRTTALLALFAPQEVFNKYNEMIDYIDDFFEGEQEWAFDTFRQKALVFLSEVRRDVGLYQDEIRYSGTR